MKPILPSILMAGALLAPMPLWSISVVYLDQEGKLTSTPPKDKAVSWSIPSPWWSDKDPNTIIPEKLKSGATKVQLREVKQPVVTTSADRREITIKTTAGSTFTIINLDGASEGFNDPTAATPVGGNSGTTLGQQRLNAFTYAANIWADHLQSSVDIKVQAAFDPLPGDASSGVLGWCGPINIYHDDASFPVSNTWYVEAQANALIGSDQDTGSPDMDAAFNSSVDSDSVLSGVYWYYGFDQNCATDIDFVSVILHEFSHGLGFLSLYDETTGAPYSGYQDAFSNFLYDETQSSLWTALTNGQRLTSMTNNGNLTWFGSITNGYAGSYTGGKHGSGRFMMYAPSPYQSGSSVSHFDTSVTPNELMEPYRTGAYDLTLTKALFRDLGWTTLNVPGDPYWVPIGPSGIYLPVFGKTETTISLLWTDNASNESSYTVYANSTANPTSLNATSYTVLNLTPNTQYQMSVTCSNLRGESAPASLSPLYTLAAAPNTLLGSNITQTSVKLDLAPDTNPAGTLYLINLVEAGQYVQSDGSLSSTMYWGTFASGVTVNNMTMPIVHFGVQARSHEMIPTSKPTDLAVMFATSVEGWKAY